MTNLTKRNGDGAGLFPTLRSWLSDRFDVDDIWNEPMFGWRNAMVPAANVKESEKEFTIELAAPGLKKSDFHINVEGNLLEISVEKESEKKDEKEGYTRREYSYNTFSRSFNLPDSVDSEKIKANYKDGLLSLMVPKKPESQKKKVKEIAIA